jgi:hypothetical protein
MEDTLQQGRLAVAARGDEPAVGALVEVAKERLCFVIAAQEILDRDGIAVTEWVDTASLAVPCSANRSKRAPVSGAQLLR